MTTRRTRGFGRSRRWIRTVTFAVLLAATPVWLGGCFGYFPLTRAVYRVNDSVEPSPLKTLLFWGFLIFPVYGVAMIVDAVILNLIDFWIPGVDFAEGGSSGVTKRGDIETTLERSSDGSQAVCTVRRKGELLGQYRFVKMADGACELRAMDGKLLGSARKTMAGDFEFLDGQGRVVRTIAAADVHR